MHIPCPDYHGFDHRVMEQTDISLGSVDSSKSSIQTCRFLNTGLLLKSPSSTPHVLAIPSVITHLVSRIELAAIPYFENNKTDKIHRLESQRVVFSAAGEVFKHICRP